MSNDSINGISLINENSNSHYLWGKASAQGLGHEKVEADFASFYDSIDPFQSEFYLYVAHIFKLLSKYEAASYRLWISLPHLSHTSQPVRYVVMIRMTPNVR